MPRIKFLTLWSDDHRHMMIIDHHTVGVKAHCLYMLNSKIMFSIKQYLVKECVACSF